MICKYCKKDRLDTEFQTAGVVNGKAYRRKKCLHCRKADRKNKRHAMQDFINNYKSSRGCYMCGVNDFRCLILHHKDTTSKKFNVATAVVAEASETRIKLELEKCEVLCANCHSILHYNEYLENRDLV